MCAAVISVLPRGAGLFLRGHHDAAGAVGEAAEALRRVEVDGLALGDETLLGGLLGDTHALADVGPRGARTAGLIDEVPDQVVGDLAEVIGREDGVGELIEWLGVHLLDGGDQVVKFDRARHAVNYRLTA